MVVQVLGHRETKDRTLAVVLAVIKEGMAMSKACQLEAGDEAVSVADGVAEDVGSQREPCCFLADNYVFSDGKGLEGKGHGVDWLKEACQRAASKVYRFVDGVTPSLTFRSSFFNNEKKKCY